MHLRPVKQSAFSSGVHAGEDRGFVMLDQMQNLHPDAYRLCSIGPEYTPSMTSSGEYMTVSTLEDVQNRFVCLYPIQVSSLIKWPVKEADMFFQ